MLSPRLIICCARIALACACLLGAHAGHAAAANQAQPAPVFAVTGPGPGQAGYVHFFIVRAPDDEWETAVGIETPDQRIAWSFLDLGVIVSPFIEMGVVPVRQRLYEVQYLYGLRPFPDEESMRVLRRELDARVLPWAESEIPYCIERGPSDPPCVSCLTFVLRILYPEATRGYGQRPHEQSSAVSKSIHSTDDFLLHLVGLHDMRDRHARLKRVDELALPDKLREDVLALVDSVDPAGDSAQAPAAAKGRQAAKPAIKSPHLRAPPPRKS